MPGRTRRRFTGALNTVEAFWAWIFSGTFRSGFAIALCVSAESFAANTSLVFATLVRSATVSGDHAIYTLIGGRVAGARTFDVPIGAVYTLSAVVHCSVQTLLANTVH